MPRFPRRRRLTRYARALRRDMTDAEMRLWWYLRANFAVRFRRQEPLGPFIVDFVSYPARLVIEVDGEQHGENRYDQARDEWLRSLGFRVLRFWNHEVLGDIDTVLDNIAIALAWPGLRPGLQA